MIVEKVVRKIKEKTYPYIHTRKVLKEATISKQKIFYFGIPMHPNLGDLAQCMCIRDFLKENYPGFIVVEIDSKVFMNPKMKLRKKLKNYVKPTDLVFFQSGYCTQDLGGVEDLMHQAVMKDYPDNRLVMMPQTVLFKTEQRKRQASEIYNKHKHLVFLARDKVSYQTAKELFPDVPLYLYPDIVTTLIGSIEYKEKRNGILMCIRNDTERFYSDKEIFELRNHLELIDTVQVIDTTIDKKITATSVAMNSIIMKYIRQLASARLVITDRYHGTILSLAADTPVIVIKTNDHKVKTGVDWFNGVYDGSVFYADSLETAEQLAIKILQSNQYVHNKPYFKEKYYNQLKYLIDGVNYENM